MEPDQSHGTQMRVAPAIATGLAAGAASAILFLPAFALWSPHDLPLPATLMLLLSPVPVGLAAWAAARRTIRMSLEAAVEGLDRLAALDCSTQLPALGGKELQELSMALERCRETQARQRHATKVHSAVARLASAAVGRLADGDVSARISVDLPQPYTPLRGDFNAAVEAMEQARNGIQAPAERLREGAREIAEAAEQLSRRAGKLTQRLEADMIALEKGGEDAEAALRKLLHTLGGARVAARRNAEAAERFADLGILVAEEAERLIEIAGAPRDREQDDSPLNEAPADIWHLPPATVPISIGATALKLER